MMMFWIIVLAIAVAAVAIIGAPLVFGSAAKPTFEEDLQSRVDAIDRDLEFGLIDDGAAREAQRDARAAEAAPTDAAGSGKVARIERFIALLSLGAAPLVAVLLYLNLGSPQSFGDKAQVPAEGLAAGGELAALEARAAAAPDDFDALMALGDAYASANRPGDSARVYAQATSLRPGDATAHAAYGEALVLEAGGAVTAEARDAFDAAIRIAPTDPRARYYLAEARYQVGAIEEAVRGWAALLDDAPADAPWFSAVAARLNAAAAEGQIALGSLGLRDATLRRLASLSDAGAAPVQTFEAALVRIKDGSAAYEDWIAAAAGYAERKDADRAREVLQRAEKKYEKAPFVLAEIKKAQAQLVAGQPISLAGSPSAASNADGVAPGADQAAAIAALPEAERRKMIEGMVAGLADRLTKEPDNLEGWRMLARSYRVLGHPAESAKAWRELLGRTEGGADDWRGLALALLEQRPQGDTAISPELERALEKLQAFDADDPLALFNLGHAAFNRGDKALALALWKRLRDRLPSDTPLSPTLDRLIGEARAG